MTTAGNFTGKSGMIGRGFLAAFLGAALLFGAAPLLHAESVEELQAQLADAEKTQGPDNVNTANVLGRLADAHRAAGDFAKAEPLYQRAMGIYEKQEGAEALGVAVMANNLAQAYADQKQYDKAESLYQRALAICEKVQPEHADTATVANNLGMFYQNQNKPEQAETMYRRALAIREKALGAESAEVAATVGNLVALYRAQGETGQLEWLRFNFPAAVEANEQAAANSAVAPETGDVKAADDGMGGGSPGSAMSEAEGGPDAMEADGQEESAAVDD